MKTAHRFALALAGQALACAATAQVTLYRDEGFQGPAYTTRAAVGNFARVGFNDRASSAIVSSERWEVCSDAEFNGRCVVLRRGQYPSLEAMGLDNRISSVRELPRRARVDDPRYAPPPLVQQDFRRRGGERLFEAPVTAVRAVIGTPEQRCWIDRERVEPRSGDSRVPGAIFGAVLGGILGHQVGGGTGRDLATVGGAVAGAAVGSNIGRGDRRDDLTRDVQRCENVPGSARPDYWDVSYRFRGQDHRVQLASAPGDTITVDRHGEPRY